MNCEDTSCPFAFTEESEMIQNYGCLPTPGEIITMRVKHDKTWACHSNPAVPCKGALHHLKTEGLPHKVVDPALVTEKHDWSAYL